MSTEPSQNSQKPENQLQPIIYGVLPNQQNDEINLGDLFSKLINQWKLIVGITLAGTVLAVLLAFILPKAYQPAITVSIPLSGNVASVAAINTLIGTKGHELPVTPQEIFTNYFNLLRSDMVLSDYVLKNNYLGKLYPDATESKSVLFAELLKERNVLIKEPTPEKKGSFVAAPKRVRFSIEVEDEAVGVDLLNGYSSYANQRLIANLQNDARETISNKIEVLSKQIARLREQHRQNRVLTIQKMEKENARKIAVLDEQITAHLRKAEANRATQVAHAKEALAMAKSLGIVYPTTVDMLAQKGQKAGSVSTAITVVDTQASSLYLKGSKYLSTLIETLEKRESDEEYLAEINNLREKIYLIKNDQILAALKERESDDPWIESLPEKLAQIDALKTISPDFSSLVSYSVDESAIITDEKVKPKRKLIAVIGFVLSLIMGIFVAMVIGTRKSDGNESR